MDHRILLKPSVEKDLRRLPSDILTCVFARIEEFRTQPVRRDAAKLAGSERLYRVRVGDYRIIFEVDHEAKQITIHYVRHRRDAYR